MKALLSTNLERRTQKVLLVGVDFPDRGAFSVDDSLAELAALVQTAGGQVVGTVIQRLHRPHAGTFIGSGKAREIATRCLAEGVDTVVFDDELSPAQGRNLEKLIGAKILDRTEVILDIFARRAQTREGKLQVELAQLQHLLPRLTRYWTHLSRQRGGLGAIGGEGESQLEADRRKVQERIDRLKLELEEVRRQRATQREGRRRHLWPLVSLVGYTNAGKSTLFNTLTHAGVLEEDKLFATLDPTTRRLRLPTNQNVLLSDTVGFIHKLPHQLIEAFKATLEEVVNADLLLHVVDISHPRAHEQMAAVNTVLEEIHAADKPVLMVLNKLDRLTNGENLAAWREQYPRTVAVSARTGLGLRELQTALANALRPVRDFLELAIPHREAAVMARLHQVGQIVERDYHGEVARFKARVPPHLRGEFVRFELASPRSGNGDAVTGSAET